MKKILFIAFLLAGCNETASCPMPKQTVANECTRGYNFYHKLAPGEDFQCPKSYKQEQVWRDVGIGLSRAPTDLVECICSND